MHELESILERIDGRGYRAYKELERRTFRFGRRTLIIDHVQGDPFAAPSRLRVQVPLTETGAPATALATAPRRVATRDLLARRFRSASRGIQGLAIDAGHQTVLDRSACLITPPDPAQAADQSQITIELRLSAELPARGRRVLGRQAMHLLCHELPGAIARTVEAPHLDLVELEQHCAVVEDQVALRAALGPAGMVAFVAEGARLARSSGVDDRPLQDGLRFEVPATLMVTLEAPNAGPVRGLGIPRGITLIVGGGFHGKSTLLRALETGVWNHVPGDGREQVVSDPGALKIRSEDGRAVHSVDISSFIGTLPLGRSTASFSTQLASGSTSQAAALVEAIEAGARTLLIDEDTSATNFMIRDRRMQALVPKAQEPITPFVDRIRELRDRLGVSTVLVMGGSGDYLDHADTVIQMDAYHPRDVTTQAAEVAQRHATGRADEGLGELASPPARRLAPATIRPETRPGRLKVQARGTDALILGRSTIDLRAVEQLVSPSQVRAIGWLLVQLSRLTEELIEPEPLLARLIEAASRGEWSALNARPDGDLALPRSLDAMAALNRLREVRLS